jgi:GT2 family glycosyltransferase
MTFAIMITTRNRREDLKHTLKRLQRLDPAPIQIFVCADGCNDGTVEMVKVEFSEIQLLVNEKGRGSIPARDRMLRSAEADWVLSLDDDSYPLVESFFAKAEKIIERHPDVTVFTFPEQRDGEVYPSQSKTPNVPGHEVSAYPNCAALMNRQVYLDCGGYPLFFVHAYEEPDYALQVYAMGKKVWFEPSLTVRHHLSAKNRSNFQTHHFNARNELWSVWIRCPMPWLLPVSLFRLFRQFQCACKEGMGWVVREPLWWWRALLGLPVCLYHRKALDWQTYYQWMSLARKSPKRDVNGSEF